MTAERESLPSFRRAWTRKVRVGGQKLFLTAGEYEDGRLGEIFLTTAKTGTLVQSLLSAWAISISVNLQCGVPLEEIVRSFEHTRFEPCGPVQGDPDIPWASSLVDYIVKRLKLTYLSGPEAVAVREPDPPAAEKVAGFDPATRGRGV